jgi:hypothetical protein
MPSWNASSPLVDVKISGPGSSVPNYAKPTAATSLRRGQSIRNRTARNSDLFLPLPAPSRPSQTRPNPNPHTENSYPPDADVRKIRRLWAKVMAGKRSGAMRPTKASLAKAKMDSGIGSASLRSPTLANPSGTGSAPTMSAKTNELDFEEMVLKPRGIRIDDSTKSVLTAFHFGVDEAPAGGLPEYYQNLSGLSKTTLWLNADESFLTDIVREYESMKEYSLNEAEHATYAIENLLKREIRSARLPKARHWMAERMIQLIAKPEKLWEQPPVLDRTVPYKPYNFDIRPDCSYWTSLQAFNPAYRKTVGEYVSIRKNRILCPYLTIEFKKDDSTLRKARNQVAVASALALYNRWKLKKDRLDAVKKPWSERHEKVLKHYGLTFTGGDYEFWCIEPTLDSQGSWSGCRMYRLAQNDCESSEGVSSFVNWVNEIHRWGLTVHGPSCERDIKCCINSTPGAVRTSLGTEGEGGFVDSEDEAGGQAEAGDQAEAS